MVVPIEKGVDMQEKIVELGHYDCRNGGQINLSIKNNVSENTGQMTQIHEMHHMHLTYVTDFGFLLNIFEIERKLSEENDEVHSNEIQKYVNVISNSMDFIQEVYANNVELILAEELVGKEYARELYISKPENYKYYCDIIKDELDEKCINFEEKRASLNLICFKALEIDITSEEFTAAYKTPRKLKEYFKKTVNAKVRLMKLIKKFRNDKYIDFERKDLDSLEVCIKSLCNLGVLKYSYDTFYKGVVHYKENVLPKIENGNLDYETIYKDYENNMLKRIQTFDLSKIRVFKNESHQNFSGNNFVVIKNCVNLENKEDNFYIIEKEIFEERVIYNSFEFTYEELDYYVRKSKFVVVPAYEYDFELEEPKYFVSNGKAVIVLFTEYKYCLEWLCNPTTSKDVFIGNLYDKTVNNFFTVLFFKPRSKAKNLYIFPTLSWLANNLVEEIEREDEVIFSNSDYFLKIMSCFDNEIDIMTNIRSVLSFVIGTKGEFSDLKDPSSQLINDLVRTISDSVMKIRAKNHHQINSILPTKNTEAEPYYTLMEFNNQNNTGNHFSSIKKGILLFRNIDIANKYRKKSCSENYFVVGVDKIYLEYLKNKADYTAISLFVCTNLINDSIRVYTLEEYEEIYLIKNK